MQSLARQAQRDFFPLRSTRDPRVILARLNPYLASVITQLQPKPSFSRRYTVIPLIVRTLRMADNLSIAAEMKRVGYARKPTQLCTLRFRKVDFVMLAVTAILSAGLCIWEANIPKPKRMPPGRSASMRPSQTVGSRIPRDRDGRAVAPRPPSADGAGRRPYQDSTKGSPK